MSAQSFQIPGTGNVTMSVDDTLSLEVTSAQYICSLNSDLFEPPFPTGEAKVNPLNGSYKAVSAGTVTVYSSELSGPCPPISGTVGRTIQINPKMAK